MIAVHDTARQRYRSRKTASCPPPIYSFLCGLSPLVGGRGAPQFKIRTRARTPKFPSRATNESPRRELRLPSGSEGCSLGVEHRTTRPYTPQTNGLAERFNGRVQREVLGITVYSHLDLEHLLRGFNQAYNARRKRVLKGTPPDEVVRQRLKAEPKLVRPHAHLPRSQHPVQTYAHHPSRQGRLTSRQLGEQCARKPGVGRLDPAD